MSGYLGRSPGLGTNQFFTFTATAGQTVFSGVDSNSYTLNYTVGFVDVYLNGRRLTPTSDFTATDGSTITLLAATSASDVVNIVAYGTFSPTDWVTNAINYVYIATASQTTFSGNDSNSRSLNYVAGTIVVSINGIIIPQSDYAALDGTSVVLNSGVNVGDIVQIFALRTLNAFNISNWITNNLTNIADYTYIATAGQTTFSGSAYAGGTLAYKANCIEVIVNGLVLTPADYTATNGTSVVLNVGCNLDDTVVIRVFGNTTVAGVYTQAQSDSKYATGNSTVMSLTASGGGLANVTPASSSTNTAIILPAKSGNIMLDGPAFHAYTTSQGFNNSTWQKIIFNTEYYDTANCFNSTQGTFTPNVAGYYQFSASVSFGGSTVGYSMIEITKNGGAWLDGSGMINNNNIGGKCHVSGLIYCNGTTDFIEVYAWQNSGGNLGIQAGAQYNFFTGALVRGV